MDGGPLMCAAYSYMKLILLTLLKQTNPHETVVLHFECFIFPSTTALWQAGMQACSVIGKLCLTMPVYMNQV